MPQDAELDAPRDGVVEKVVNTVPGATFVTKIVYVPFDGPAAGDERVP